MEYEKLIIHYKQWDCTLDVNKFGVPTSVKKGEPLLYRIDLRDAETGEPIATVNKYINGLSEGEIAIDVNNLRPSIIKLLMVNEIIEGNSISDAVGIIPVGFVDYPVYKLHPNFILWLKQR
jgi:hypothetical protein